MSPLKARVIASYRNLNQWVINFANRRTTQEILGVIFMFQALAFQAQIERGQYHVVHRFAEWFGIAPFIIPAIWLCFAWWCFQRDRLPIHYVIALIPQIIYGVIAIEQSLADGATASFFLAAISRFGIIMLAWVGVVQQYRLAQIMVDLAIRDQRIKLLSERIDALNTTSTQANNEIGS